MTSNIGSPHILGESDEDRMRQAVTAALGTHFRPEFLNRLTDTIIFHRLDVRHIVRIVDLQLAEVQTRLRDRHMTLALTPSAKHALAERGYDPNYGARPLKRLIEREIVNVLAKKLLAGAFHDRDTIAVDLGSDGEFTFARRPPPTETDSTNAA